MASLFEIPIEKINGIGSKRGQLYRKLGIDSVGALVRFYPRSYEDWSNPISIFEGVVGQICCIKGVVSTPTSEHRIPGGKILVTTRISDGFSFMKIAFFNNKYIKNKLIMGDEYIFYGRITDRNGIKEMINPMFEHSADKGRMRPVYRQAAGLTSRQIEASVRKAMQMLPNTIKDPIPENIRLNGGYLNLKDAIVKIHFPNTKDDIAEARRRLIFDELLVLSLGLHFMKKKPAETCGVNISKDYSDDFFNLLPFNPTNAQKRAIRDCITDLLNSERPMNRLIQGDVGSGKTIVAAAAAFTSIKNGCQVALMVPTEILAKQHFETFIQLFEHTDICIELLTGTVSSKKKKRVLAGISDGSVNLVIGTHALISDGVDFSKLGLVITDEQHRFGVRQRAALIAKGLNPHLMVMSATPIPRTLALMIYGDLDLSVIDELPPGRQKVDTFLIDDEKRVRAFNFLIRHIEQGRQCYIVCPAVDENELGIIGAEEYAKNIKKQFFNNYRVEVVHGKMNPIHKEEIMSDFVEGKINVLVSTTVIEVGVNVPNAVIMMIENAERFGLSQLHQLRGRVGRGDHKSYCILVSNAKNEDTLKRLKILCSTNDGFKIADEDLKNRGPGDFFGSRQHGLPELQIADLAENMDDFRRAQIEAQNILASYPDLNDDSLRGLRAEVKQLFGRVGNQLN